jgi:hypothetical protein
MLTVVVYPDELRVGDAICTTRGRLVVTGVLPLTNVPADRATEVPLGGAFASARLMDDAVGVGLAVLQASVTVADGVIFMASEGTVTVSVTVTGAVKLPVPVKLKLSEFDPAAAALAQNCCALIV